MPNKGVEDVIMGRWLKSVKESADHWCAPENGFASKIPVWITPDEFHLLCTRNPDIYETHRLYGVLLLIEWPPQNRGLGGEYDVG